ncbi:MAG: hypothetical protein EPN22_01485 [Nitrospirae bacterium]|nr:MAG: hypothetical protein EPN22_01485 [Nitrospirota bacterium]
MATTLKIDRDDALIVKESLELDRNIMKLSLLEYRKKLKGLEKKHKMTTKAFLQKFNAGALGDDGEWFDWLFASKACEHVKERLNRIAAIV